MHFLDDPFLDTGKPIRHVGSYNSPALIWPLRGWKSSFGKLSEEVVMAGSFPER